MRLATLFCSLFVMAGFSAAKLLWVRKHRPEVFARIA